MLFRDVAEGQTIHAKKFRRKKRNYNLETNTKKLKKRYPGIIPITI